MAKIDARRVKIHRNYTITDAALCIGVHKNTVAHWINKGGLAALTDCRPHLILGPELKRFLDAKRQAARKPCAEGELFCLKCRAPRRPAGNLLDYEPFSSTSGNLKGICQVCETIVCRRIKRAEISTTFPNCHVAFPQYQQRLTELA